MSILITLFKIHLQVIYFFIKLFTKVDDKKILFLSRQGDKMSIDFELLRDDIHKRYKDYKLVILTKWMDKKHLVEYYFHLYKQMYNIATSKVVLADDYIIPLSILKHKKKTTIIEICHGISNIKQFGYQTLKKESGKGEKMARLMKMHRGYDYLISTSKETSKFYSKAFDMPINKIVNIGNPKIDYILGIDKYKNKVLKKYPHLKDKPVILYVSTFRTYDDDYLKEFVKAAPVDKFNVIMHIHPVAYLYHPDIDKEIDSDKIYRCKDVSTQELLSVADICITDYSSFIFESAILEKPTYLYIYDYDKYIEKNGLNVDLKKELGKYAFADPKELFKSISKGKYDYKTIKEFKEKYVSNCDGKATEKMTDFLIEQSKK